MEHKIIFSLLLLFCSKLILPQQLAYGQSETLLPIIIDEKWGIINLKGEILIEPQFDFMPKFNNNGLATITENGKLGIIDSIGTKIISSQYDDLRIIKRQLYLASIDGKWGIIKKNESVVLPIQYDQILSLSSQFFQVKKGAKVGLSNQEGNLVVPIEFDEIKLAYNGYYLIKLDDKWGIYHEDNGVVLECSYELIEAKEKNIFFVVQDGKWGTFLPELHKETIPTLFDAEAVLQKGLPYILVYHKKMKGLYHKNGKAILEEPSAIDIEYFGEGLFMVLYRNNRWGILNDNGEWLVNPKWKNCNRMNTNFIVLQNKFGKKALYSTAIDSIIIPPKFDLFERFSSELIIARGGKESALIMQSGQLITMGKYKKFKSLNEGIYAATDGYKWSLFNSNGKQIIETSFDKVTSFLPSLKVSKVYNNGLRGLLKPNGQWFIEPKYSSIRVFDDVIKAYHDEKVTIFYLNESGKIDDTMTFNNVNIVRVNSIDMNEKKFEEGISSDSTTTTRFQVDNSKRKRSYIAMQFGTFNNRWALWNTRSSSFKDLENHEIVRFLYTFGKYEIRFGWMYPNKVLYDSTTNSNRVKISKRKEKVDYSKRIFNKPKNLHIGYVGLFKEGRARVNIGGKFKSVGLNYTTKRYDLGNEVKGLITRRNRRRLEQMVGRSSNALGVEYTYICAGGFWGFINEDGKLIADFDYSYVSNFHNGVAIAEKKGKWGIVDTNNNEVIPFKYSYIDYLPDSDSTLFRLHSNEKLYGYVDSLGRQIVPTQFEKINAFTAGLAPAKQAGIWGFINKKGEWVIENKFEDVRSFSEGIAAAKFERQWGFIDKSGSWVIEPQFREVGDFTDGIAAAKKGLSFGYIDLSGEWVIQPKYQRAGAFNNDIAIAKSKGKFGLIDKKGNWKLSPKLKRLTKIDTAYFMGAKKAWGLIDKDGKELTKYKYASIDKFINGYALVRKKAGNYYKSTYGFINEAGEEIIKPKFRAAGRVKDGLIRVKNPKEDWKYINLNEEVVFSGDYENCTDFSEGKAIVFTEKGNKKGGKFINKNGEIILNNPTYEAVENFNNGRAIIRDYLGEYAYFDSLGQVIKDAFYQNVMPFQHKISFVQKDEKWAITNLASVPVSQFKFDEVSPFKNGVSKVAINIHYGITKANGQSVAPPHFETVKSINDDILMVASANRLGYINIKTGDWLWPLQN